MMKSVSKRGIGVVVLTVALVTAFATLARAQETPATPAAAAVESDPIKCWWKTQKSAIRIGERFGLTITCGVIETEQIRVVADQTSLDPAAIELAPFEVIGGIRHRDVVSPPWRYFQYSYTLRLLDDEYFGRDLNVPPIQLTYNVQSSGGGGARGLTQAYGLPALSMRILSLVPLSASDISDASSESFADMEARTFRASSELAAAAIFFAFAFVLAVLGAVRFVGKYRTRTPVEARPLAAGTVLRGCVRMAGELHTEVSGSGWTPELIGRALAILRVAGAVAVGRPVAQALVDTGVREREGQVAVRLGLLRSRRAMISASTTAANLAGTPAKGRSRQAAAVGPALEDIQDSIRVFSAVRYRPDARFDTTALDEALERALNAIRRLRVTTLWPNRMADAVAGAAAGLRDTVWSR
jgi:hypothetical protein